jgi:uncharacterized protein (DUF488 family)
MQLFTIGHSTHTIENFINLLKNTGIDTLVDVRSSPYSKYNPQYNKETLKTSLSAVKINYIFMGEELGARHKEPQVLEADGRVNFEKVRELDTFKKGIERLKIGMEKGYKIVLMCSEKDPIECHRFSLVSYALKKEGVQVKHVLEDGSVVDNSVLEAGFLNKVPNMFKTKEEEIEEGYKILENKVAFVNEVDI